MKKLLKFISLGVLLTGLQAHAAIKCPTDRSDYFCLSPEMRPNSSIQMVDFYSIPLQIMSLFRVELDRLNAPLALDAHWESPYFGAGISYHQNQYHLMILGGMTRIDKMTKDAYAAIVCHEIGHLIGGAPYQTIAGAEFSSSEGQADFFAASVCLPKYFKSIKSTTTSEKAGFEMMDALKDYDSNEPNAQLVRGLVYKVQARETLINKYPKIQCRYETFRNPAIRSACWFRD